MNKLAETAQETVERVEGTAQDLKEWDDSRPDFPGEHWIVAAAGLALLMAAGRARTPLKAMLLTAAGSAALGRAASGRGGIARLAGWLVRK